MVKTLSVTGFSELEDALKTLEPDQVVFILFSGSNGADGSSWCSDCNIANPVIERSMEYVPEGATFVHCAVGDRDSWKNKTNPFRTKMGINSVPTLLKWGTGKSLEEHQLTDLSLIRMLYEEED